MKYYSSLTEMKYKWDQVATAFWNRYPNPYSSHVLTEDTLNRQVKGGKLYSTRLITKTNKLPKWGERFMPGGQTVVCVVEESVVDPKQKTLTTYTRNIGYTKIMMVEEKCTYTQSSENKGWTQCERQAWISSNVFGFAMALQAFGLERFRQNAGKTLKGFEHVLNRMYVPENIAEPAKVTKKEKLKTTAKKATELAKAKAVPVVAKYGGTAAS